MSDVIDRPILDQERAAATRLRIIDCDVHPSLHAHSDLNAFLPRRWQEHLKTYGGHLRTPYIGTTPYPRSSPLIARRDAWPPTGGPPGSDLAFTQKQHLDPFDVEFGILQVLDLFIFSQQNLEFGAARVGAHDAVTQRVAVQIGRKVFTPRRAESDRFGRVSAQGFLGADFPHAFTGGLPDIFRIGLPRSRRGTDGGQLVTGNRNLFTLFGIDGDLD